MIIQYNMFSYWLLAMSVGQNFISLSHALYHTILEIVNSYGSLKDRVQE